MYRTVRELNEKEMMELKEAYFYDWADDWKEIGIEKIGLEKLDLPEDVPDWAIYQLHDGVLFVDEDFMCNLD